MRRWIAMSCPRRTRLVWENIFWPRFQIRRLQSFGCRWMLLTTAQMQRTAAPRLRKQKTLLAFNMFLSTLGVALSTLGFGRCFFSFWCFLALSDFPNNSQFILFFREFATYGYKSYVDSVVCKFPYADGSRTIELFSVGISDGFTKILLMLSLVAFSWELELGEAEVADLKDIFVTLKYVRCTYMHFANPSLHFLNSLRFLVVSFSCFGMLDLRLVLGALGNFRLPGFVLLILFEHSNS